MNLLFNDCHFGIIKIGFLKPINEKLFKYKDNKNNRMDDGNPEDEVTISKLGDTKRKG